MLHHHRFVNGLEYIVGQYNHAKHSHVSNVLPAAEKAVHEKVEKYYYQKLAKKWRSLYANLHTMHTQCPLIFIRK